jgi:hypothetical protein
MYSVRHYATPEAFDKGCNEMRKDDFLLHSWKLDAPGPDGGSNTFAYGRFIAVFWKPPGENKPQGIRAR